MEKVNAEWCLSKEKLMNYYNVTMKGLSYEQVEKNRARYGANELKEGKKKTVLEVFWRQFCDLLVIILITAATISLFSNNVESAVVILLVIVMNALLGTVQHIKAQRSLESLKQLSSPIAKVIRQGVKREIVSKDVVPGDIIVLEAGDMIVADGRIVSNYSLQVNESSLTGESANIDKTECVLDEDVALADRINMVHSGSLVTYGRAEVIVTSTGMDTQIGKIAGLMNAAKMRKTPLQESLDDFSRKLAVLVMIICGLVFILCLYRQMPMLDSMMFAVALAVAAIPEALSSIVTIVQAFGTQKMARENAVIKQLKAVESLGCVSVICSDKTGTLTMNKMTVENVYVDGKIIAPHLLDLTNQTHRYFLYDAVLTNDSVIVDGKGVGDPTEYALLEMFRSINVSYNKIFEHKGIHEDNIRSFMIRTEELPFDSDRKLMSTKYAIHGKPTILTKGAPDILLERCVSVRYSDGIRALSEHEKQEIIKKIDYFSQNGLRVLAFAYKESNEKLAIEAEKDFTFLGLAALVDPPRPESMKAINDAKRAGIRPVMITGDHKITAIAIAKQIGIYEEGDEAVTGMELDALSDEELDKKIGQITVYARVSPENKIRIVDSWQRRGNIVAMTGDGVNDAPALKKADIGVAMGVTGTDVSKDAADMILSDDNFATIIKAVSNGRNVYRNIKNAILFLLSGNTAGILAVLYTSIMALPVPFAPVHLLFINLLTDSLPAIAIGMESVDIELLKEKPRDPTVGMLTRGFLFKMFWQGGLIAISSMIAFYIGLRTSAAMASTMAFATLTLARLFHGFNCRGDGSILKLGVLSNRFSVIAFVAGVTFLSLVLFVPFLQHVFNVEALALTGFIQVFVLAIIPTIIIQFTKIIGDIIRN